MNNNKNNILSGNIFIALTKFSIPILFSLILQALYGAVDLWMVSQFATNADVSAVSTGSQTIMIVTGIITGLSMGITVILGQAIGQKDNKKSADTIGTSTWIFLAIGIITTIILILTASPLATLLNAPEKAFDKTVEYITICGIGIIFVVAFNVFNGIFCGIGDSNTPLLFVGIACVVNIIGDYVLIDKLALGARGAAIATIAAQAVSVIFSFIIIKKRLPFSISKSNFKYSKNIAKSIIKLGTPVALLRMCTEVSYLLILGFVNKFGEVASSGVGIAEKLVMFIMLVPMAYMSSISAFVAQNIGANQIRRAKKSLWIGIISATTIGGIMAYLSFFHGDTMSLIFIKDQAVIDASAEFLKATSIECFILSISYCFDGYFNGIGKTTTVMIRGVLGALVVRIPLAYFISSSPNATLFQIGMSTAIAAIFMLIFCIIEYLTRSKKQKS